MNKAIGSIGSVVITFLVTLLLNTVLNYYTNDKGTVSISKPIKIDQTSVVIVTIENYTGDFINGLVLEVPVTLSASAITAEPAIVIEELQSPARNQSKLLKLTQVRPRHVSRLLIATADAIQASAIRVANLEATGLAQRVDDRLESPLRAAVIPAFFGAVFYAIILGGFSFVLYREQLKLSEKLDKLKAESATLRSELKSDQKRMEKEFTVMNGVIVKHRLLLLARLHDYAKELAFWRNTIKMLLLQSGGQNLQADDLIGKVTAALGTFGTLSQSEKDFEAIKVASRWMADAESDANKLDRSQGVGTDKNAIDDR